MAKHAREALEDLLSPELWQKTCREKGRVGTGADEDQERVALRAEPTYWARLISVR